MLFLATLMAFTLAGCATQKINWPARVGNYTHDQAVLELGPPDREARLTNGVVISDWLLRRGDTIVQPQPYFVPPGDYFGPLTPTYTTTHMPDYYLQLTFAPDGKLEAWKKIAR